MHVYPLWEVWAELVFPRAQFVLDRWHSLQDYWTDTISISPNHINSTDEDSAKLDRSSPPLTPLVEQNRETESADSVEAALLAVVAVQLS